MRAALRFVRVLRLESLLSLGSSTRSFADYFKDFDRVEAVREIFGDKTETVLQGLRVDFSWFGGYMWVNSLNGHIMVSSRYLNEGDRIDIYLDVIHELVHVKQLMDGRELFDVHFGYVERPTEIEAYRHSVEEARRLGLSDQRICDYLQTEWMSKTDLKKLAAALNVQC